MYLQPKPKKPLGHPNPNGLIYLIHNETFIEKILKFTLATLGVLTLIVAILGIMLYRNLGGLPDESRFAHLSYYKNGQKNQQLLKKPKNKQCFKAIHAKIKNTRQDLIYKFTTQPVKDNAPVRKAEQVCQ